MASVVVLVVSSATWPSDDGVEDVEEVEELSLPLEFEPVEVDALEDDSEVSFDFEVLLFVSDCSLDVLEVSDVSVFTDGSRQKKNHNMSQTIPPIINSEMINQTNRPAADVFGCSYIPISPIYSSQYSIIVDGAPTFRSSALESYTAYEALDKIRFMRFHRENGGYQIDDALFIFSRDVDVNGGNEAFQ